MQVVPWTQNYHSLQELNNQKATELVRPDLSVIQVATFLRKCAYRLFYSVFIKDQSVIRDWLPNMAAVPHAQQHATLLLPHGTQFNSPHEIPTRKATSVNILAILRRMKVISPVQKTTSSLPQERTRALVM